MKQDSEKQRQAIRTSWQRAAGVAVLASTLGFLFPANAEPAKDSGVAAESVFKERLDGTDVTSEFNALYDGPADKVLLSEKQKAQLSRYDVLLVPGFLTSLYLQIGKFVEQTVDKKDVLNYLREAHEALDALGIKTEQVFLNKDQFNTLASVAVNADRMVRAIQKSAATGKRVILISHSKGGNDALAALLTLQRTRKLKTVAGWISVQSSFSGSPVADRIMQSESLKKGAKALIEGLGGTLDSLSDMTSPVCTQIQTTRGKEIRKLVKSVPILSFASWKPKPQDFQTLHPDTVLAPTRDLMAGRGMQNDGLVPTKSAILPGTAYIAKLGLDHAEVAMANQPPVIESRLDRKKFVQVLLSMLLRRLPSVGKQRIR